jgi:hypothetical protein
MTDKCKNCITLQNGECAIWHSCKWFSAENFYREVLRRANECYIREMAKAGAMKEAAK